MKKLFIALSCVLTCGIHAFEYHPQFENNQISVATVKIMPHEEIAPHYDICPQVVFALKGGSITRFERDGSSTDVVFSTGEAIFRDVNLENEPHSSINRSSEPLELIVIKLKSTIPNIKNDDKNTHEIAIGIKINCPMSDEFSKFVESIPQNENTATDSFDEWRDSFIDNMTQLIQLVKSGKTSSSWWSVQTD